MRRRVEAVTAALVAVPFLVGAASGAEGPQARVEFRFADPDIVESSGLVARDGLFATVNDSGDSGRTFVVDPATGETVGGARWAAAATDIEALAPTPDGGLLVGDIGDNDARRDSVTLLEVPLARGSSDVTPTTYELTYPDGATDAEALLVHPVTGQVLVASKNILGGVLYTAPERLRTGEPAELRPLADVAGFVTDGAFFPDGRHLVLRDYGQLFVHAYPSMELLATLSLPAQEQGEGVAVDEDGAVFVSSEGQRSPVLRVPLPDAVADAVRPLPEPEPTGATDGDQGEGEQDGDEAPGDGPPDEVERPAWVFWLGGAVGLLMIAVLIRSLRPR